MFTKFSERWRPTPLVWKRARLTPRKYSRPVPSPTCYYAKFGRSRSDYTNVITEIRRKISPLACCLWRSLKVVVVVVVVVEYLYSASRSASNALIPSANVCANTYSDPCDIFSGVQDPNRNSPQDLRPCSGLAWPNVKRLCCSRRLEAVWNSML